MTGNGTSIYERKGSRKWYLTYWCATRMKRVHEASPWRVDDPNGYKHAHRFAAAKSKEAEAFRGTAKHETWSAWVDTYLADRYRLQAKTLKRYLNAWDWLRVFLIENQLHHPRAVSYQDVMNYIVWRTQKKRRSGRTICRNTAMVEVKVFSVITREAVRRGFCDTNPCERLGLHRDPPAEKPEITDAQVRLIFQLLAARESALPIAERWMTVCFTIALYHGCRLSETQIPMAAVDLARRTVRFSAKGKNGVPKVYTIGIHPAALSLFRELDEAGATVTCLLPKMASKEWHTFFKGREELANLCFHCTRVTVVTRMARAGVPIQQAMSYVSHASQTVHRIYQRLRAEDLSLCAQALSFPSATG